MTQNCSPKYKPTRLARVIEYTAYAVLIYLVFVLFAPMFLNGNLYHIESPVPVTVESDQILIHAHRTSIVSGPASHATRITCDNVLVQFADRDHGTVSKGDDIVTIPRPIPEGLSGECIIEGVVEYNIMPLLTLHHEYYTETFIIE